MYTTEKVVYKQEVLCCNSWKLVKLPKGSHVLSALHKEPVRKGDGILIYYETDIGQGSETTSDLPGNFSPKSELYEFLAIGTGMKFRLSTECVFLGTVRVPAPILEVYHVYYHKIY